MVSERLTIQDAHKAGYCVSGIRDWFQRHGMDYMEFARHGIDMADVAHIDDGFIEKVAEQARKRNGR